MDSGEVVNDIKGVKPDDVWLSDGGLLVLKGGVSRFSARNGATSERRKWVDNPWEPLDDYQAPFREPILPPPDFIPNDTGVGVPLPPENDDTDNIYNTLYVRKPKNERALNDNEIRTLPPSTKKKIKSNYIYIKDDKKYPAKELPQPPPRITFDPILDEEQYINEMANFRPERRHASQEATQPRESEYKRPNELLLVKTKPLLVDHPPNPPNLVTIHPFTSHTHPLTSPSPLITPPTEHTRKEDRVTTSTTTISSITVSSLPRLSKTTRSSTISSSYAKPSPTNPSGYFVSTSTPSSYSFAFQTSYKSKPLIVKNRARAVLSTTSPLNTPEDLDSKYNSIRSSSPHPEQITTPMYTTQRSPPITTTTTLYKPTKSSPLPFYAPDPEVTTVKSTPINIAINGSGERKGGKDKSRITTTKIKVKSTHDNNINEEGTTFYKTLAPRIQNLEEAKYYKGHGVTSINSIYDSLRDKKSLHSSEKSTSFQSNPSPPYFHVPSVHQTKAKSISPTISDRVVDTPAPTIRTLPPRDPATVFKKLSKKFAFGKKLYPNEKPLKNKHRSLLSPSANDIFSNEISDNDVGTRRRDRVVGNTHYLVNKGRNNRNVRKLPNYHFTVGKFPTNPFTALKRKLSARSKKDKKRKRHYIRPWHSKKLPSDPVTVGSNAISKLAR